MRWREGTAEEEKGRWEKRGEYKRWEKDNGEGRREKGEGRREKEE